MEGERRRRDGDAMLKGRGVLEGKRRGRERSSVGGRCSGRREKQC